MFMMKSRIVFLCTLAAFLSPMSVMADGLGDRTSDILAQHDGKSGCNLWAEKMLGTTAIVSPDSNGKAIKKAGEAQ
jgi:hypothetical protein